MKALFVLALSLATLPAFAASSKVCFGTGSDKGTGFAVELTKKTAKVTRNWGQIDWMAGNSYQTDGKVQSRNGKTLVSYDLGNADGANNLLVEEQLLDDGSEGTAYARNRGEGFSQTRFFCKDGDRR